MLSIDTGDVGGFAVDYGVFNGVDGCGLTDYRMDVGAYTVYSTVVAMAVTTYGIFMVSLNVSICYRGRLRNTSGSG